MGMRARHMHGYPHSETIVYCREREKRELLQSTLVALAPALTIALVTNCIIQQSSSIMSDFFEVIKNNDVMQVKGYLQRGVDVNQKWPADGTTALYWAACCGHVRLCQMLIERGAHLDDVASHWGSRALHAAADRGRHDCVTLLIRSGANPNVQCSSNLDTPLHKAAYRGHEDICRLLLQNGADPRLQNKEGKTARQEAQNKKYYSLYHLLLEYEHNAKKPVQAKMHTQQLTRPEWRDELKIQGKEISLPACYERPYPSDFGHVTTEINSCEVVRSNVDHNENSKVLPTDSTTNGSFSHKNGHGSVSSSLLVNCESEIISPDEPFPQEHSDDEIYDDLDSYPYSLNERNLLEIQNRHDFNQDSHQELLQTTSQLRETLHKLKTLEQYTEKLQIAITNYRDKIAQLKKESDHYKYLAASTGDLEEQLRVAQTQIAVYMRANSNNNKEVTELKQQVSALQAQYAELEVSYKSVCDILKKSQSSLNDNNEPASSNYDADTESMNGRIHQRIQYRLLGRGSSPDSSKNGSSHKVSSSSSSGNPSPLQVPQASREDTVPISRTSRYPTVRSKPTHASSHPTVPEVPMPLAELNMKPLLQAITPVFTSAGKEFMDMLTTSLLFQTKNTLGTNVSAPLFLDKLGTVWRPNREYYINYLLVNITCSSGSEMPFWMMFNVTHKNNWFNLKVIINKHLTEDIAISVSVDQIQLIQNKLLRTSHRNISQSLHGFRERPCPEIYLHLPKICHELNVTGLHTVQQYYPGNLQDFIHECQLKYTEPSDVFQERFILHLLYGILSGLAFLRDMSIIHSNVSALNIDLNEYLQPIICNSEFGFSTKGLSGEDLVISEEKQLHHGYTDDAPPEVLHQRYLWKQGKQSKVYLRDLFRASDIYILGLMFINILTHGWKNSTTDHRLHGYTWALNSLLNWLITPDFRERPSARKAKIRVAILLFGPKPGEVKSLMECQVWHQTKMMKCLLNSQEPMECKLHKSAMVTVAASVNVNDVRLEHDYLTSTSADEIWTVYKSTETT